MSTPQKTPGKETIYIDVDDEITSIIDKVKGSPNKIVALVLPKRATVLQSIVNMKLLKRAASTGKKNIVLITSEVGLLPLAGAVGLHVAKNLQSKPEIPPPPHRGDNPDTPEDESISEDTPVDPTKPVGALAAAHSGRAAAADDDTETIELDNMTLDTPAAPADAKKASKGGKKAKPFKIPSFERFRLGLLIGGLALIALIFGWYFAFVVMPKAVVTIKTDATTISANLTLAASESFKEVDVEGRKLPAVKQQLKKTDTEKVPATGKKDTGTKATGTISIKNCEDSEAHPVAAGSVFSASGKNFFADTDVSVPAGSFSGGGTVCNSAAVSVAVTAAESGDAYNLAAQAYTHGSLAGRFSIVGSAMSGGTSNIITVVSQEDVDAAAAKMRGRLDQQGKDEFKAQLASAGLIGLDDTLVISDPAITPAPAVGDKAAEVTVSSVVTYDIVGIKQTDLANIVGKEVEKQIDTARQTVLDDGLKTATIRSTLGNKQYGVSVQTTATAGTRLNESAIKEQIRGKKRGEVESSLNALPGVKDVTVEYSPFWVLSTPKASKKITIVMQKGQQEKKGSTNGNNP